MKPWTRKPFLLIFVSLVCCRCKHASHSKDLFLTHALHHHLAVRGGESDGHGIAQGRKQQSGKSKGGDWENWSSGYTLAFFQSNRCNVIPWCFPLVTWSKAKDRCSSQREREAIPPGGLFSGPVTTTAQDGPSLRGLLQDRTTVSWKTAA